MIHPDELLAEYVEGGLNPSARAEVEAHLRACGVCRAEVADATSARQTLLDLPEVPEPPGLTLDVVRRARGWRPRRLAPLAVAAVVLLLAGAVGGAVVVVLGQGDRGSRLEAEAPAAADGEEALAEDAGAEEEPAGAARAETLFAGYPQLRRTGTEYDAGSLPALGQELQAEARSALESGFPPDPIAFYDAVPVARLSPGIREALLCAGQGLEPERTVVPFVIEGGSFEGRDAWIVAFLKSAEPSDPYELLEITVVARDDCSLLSFAVQQL